jgi:ArsR family transcriptional regulator
MDIFVTEEALEGGADLLRTMGHPVRLNILRLLLEEDSCVKNIWSCLEIPQATVSQHLAILKNKGIVEGRREGTIIRYSVANPQVRRIIEVLSVEEQ